MHFLAESHISRPSLLLRSIHGYIRISKHILGLFVPRFHLAKSKTGRNHHLSTTRLQGMVQFLQNSLCNSRGLFHGLDFIEQQCELISTISTERILWTAASFQTPRNFDQYKITQTMSETIIDGFETV